MAVTMTEGQTLNVAADELGMTTVDLLKTLEAGDGLPKLMPTMTGPWAGELPRRVRSIHQIEVTSKCNLRCVYCPSKDLPKLRGEPPTFITREHFSRALEWAVHFEENWGTQGELSITGIGESLMHPDFVDMIREAREALPHNDIVFSTNGILLTEKLCEQLAPYNPRIYVSLHRPEKAGHAVQAAKKFGLLADVNVSAATNAFDWAGQVDWYVSAPEGEANPCEYLRSGWGVVLANGSITTCCLDASNKGIVGHVDDDIGSVFVKPYELCGDCHMSVPGLPA